MNLDYTLLVDSAEESGKSPRNQLRQIINNRAKVWVPISHLIRELESNSGSRAKGERSLDPIGFALEENELKLPFHFIKIRKNKAKPERNELYNQFNNQLFSMERTTELEDIKDYLEHSIEVPRTDLIKLITEDAVELKEFGPFLESGSNAKNNTVWFPFASLKVTISNLLVKSNLPSEGNCESANSERVNNVRTAESLAQTRLVEEELGSYNLHRWFIINLLWEKNDYEIAATQAWNKFTELTRQEWLENPKQDKSWFKFRSHKQAKLVVMLNEKNDKKAEEFFEDLKSRSTAHSLNERNSDAFWLTKDTFMSYFNKMKGKRKKGDNIPKLFYDSRKI